MMALKKKHWNGRRDEGMAQPKGRSIGTEGGRKRIAITKKRWNGEKLGQP